eukprot:COSAG05_NODE_53_length_23772_cov_13.856630_12_plen_1197_part_00
MPKSSKKGSKKGEQSAVSMEEELHGTIEKFCGTGFKPRYFRLEQGLLRYSRSEPVESDAQDTVAVTYAVNLRKKFDHQAMILDSTRELQFSFQGHTFRLRTETSELRDKWFSHLKAFLQQISSADIIYSSMVECAGSSSFPNAFAHLQDGSMLVCSTPVSVNSLDFQASEPSGDEPKITGELVAGLKVRMAGKAKAWTVLQSKEGRVQIQMEGSAVKKWAEKDQLTAWGGGQVNGGFSGASVDGEGGAPKQIPMGHVTDLQDGFDDEAGPLSVDPKLEFQFILFNKPQRFRVKDAETKRKWLTSLDQELAAASASKDDAVTMLHNLLSPALEQAPLVDEDIHYILYYSDEKGLTAQDPSEKASFSVDSKDTGVSAAYEDELSPIGKWLGSLGIRKSQEYAQLMEVQHELEMEDLQHLTEANLVEIGITAVGPRNRILREIAFMRNQNKDPTIDEDGSSATMQIQFYVPYSAHVVSEDISLDTTVEDVKRKLLADNFRKAHGAKAKVPSQEQMDTLVKEHEIRVVAQLGRWDDDDIVLDDTSILREVPSIFYCFTNQTTPRLSLMSASIAEMKKGILQTLVTSGTSDAEAGGAFGQLGNSTQLKRLRTVIAGVHYLVDADSVVDKRAMLQRRTLLASTDDRHEEHVDRFDIQVFPAHASRYESLTLDCTETTTVRQVLDDFIEQYENGRWGKVLNERKRAGVALKRHGRSEYMYDDDRVIEYNFVRYCIREMETPQMSLDFSPLFEEIRAATKQELPVVPRGLAVVVKELSWISPAHRARMGWSDEDEVERVEIEGTGDVSDDSLASEMSTSSDHLDELERNPLSNLNMEEQQLMWMHRHEPRFRRSPRMLSKMLMSVPDWDDHEVVEEVYSFIDPRNPERWPTLGPAEALRFFDPLFWDSVLMVDSKKPKKCKTPFKTFRPFKEHAVRCLVGITDTMVVDYIPQLVQLMKNETLQDSALGKFLMYRALRNPYFVGQTLYWSLRAEMAASPPEGQHTHSVIDTNAVNRLFTLFGLFLRRYLDHCGAHREELIKQEELVQQLRKVAQDVKVSPDAERLKVLRNDIRQLTFPQGGVRLPVNGGMQVKGILVDKCRYMDSAKKPLWLEFVNVDASGDNVVVIFKDGDDVRQDQLCLQMFKIMMDLWKESDVNIPMVPYGCVTLAFEVGMLEVVTQSNTLSNITKVSCTHLVSFGTPRVWP